MALGASNGLRCEVSIYLGAWVFHFSPQVSSLKHLSSTWALHLMSMLGVGFYFSLDPWAFFSLGSLHRTVWHRNRSAVLILIADTLHLLERA